MPQRLKGKRIAILATDGVERIELTDPCEALEKEGAVVELLAPKAGSILALDHLEKREELSVDRRVSEADPGDYDGLVLPGGVVNADKLRTDADAVRFVRAFMGAGGAVGVICHGAWIIIETGLLKGRTLTSYPSLRTDLENAGAHWVDEEVHIDDRLISSRRPRDLPAFISEITRAFAEDHRMQKAG